MSTDSASSSEIRKKVIDVRKRLSPAELQALSSELITRFTHAAGPDSQKWRGLHVALYRALPPEPDLRALEPLLQANGCTLCFPRIKDRVTKQIEFVQVDALDSHESWKIGPYGIEEPHDHHPVVDPARIDVVFVPGLAFGTSGERIGMGAGYYDRFLSQHAELNARALRIALVFDFQLFQTLPQKPWDQRVHWVLTESREARTDQAERWLSS